ncbi:MAG: hypothetical protein ABI577_11340 [bacterium]
MLYERAMVLRGLVAPRWRRRLRMSGFEHVKAGIEAGKGVILWTQPCLGSNLCVKQALHDSGYPLAHLTRPSHGFSPSDFGIRFANPVLRHAESRFLAERVVIDAGNSIRPLRRMRALLRENRVISITVSSASSRILESPFLGGTLLLPAGPIELAAQNGSVILPVFTVGSGRTVNVIFGPALPVGDGKRLSVEDAHETVTSWLAELIAAHPLDWIGWRADTFRPGLSNPAYTPGQPNSEIGI